MKSTNRVLLHLLLVLTALLTASCGPGWEPVYIEYQLPELTLGYYSARRVHAAILLDETTYSDRGKFYTTRKVNALFSNNEDFSSVGTICIDTVTAENTPELHFYDYPLYGRGDTTLIAFTDYLRVDYYKTVISSGRTFITNHDSSDMIRLSEGITINIEGGTDSTLYKLEYDTTRATTYFPTPPLPTEKVPVWRTNVTSNQLRFEPAELTGVVPERPYTLYAIDKQVILDTLSNGKVLAVAFDRKTILPFRVKR